MSPAQFRACRGLLGLTQAALAFRMDLSIRTIKYYEKGNQPIPEMVRLGMHELMRRHHTTQEEPR